MQCPCGGVTKDHTYQLANGNVVDVKTCTACGREDRKVTVYEQEDYPNRSPCSPKGIV